MSDLYKEIYEIVKKIPLGKVSSYGQIAAISGNFRRSRVVGYAMSACKDPSVPCHRVIYSNGSLSNSFGLMGTVEQKERLISEGVKVIDGKVDMNTYLWQV